MKMKPRFRLHAHLSSPGLPPNCIYWTCSVDFSMGCPTPDKVEMNTAHSGPCVLARGAIAEADLLMRRATGHEYR